MDTQEINTKLKAILVKSLGVDESEITPSADIMNDLGADSLDCVEIVCDIESQFKITIPDEDAEKLLTPADWVRYLEGRV